MVHIIIAYCSYIIVATYCAVLKGSEECIYSKEGVTQGDPLSCMKVFIAIIWCGRWSEHPNL